MDISPPKTFTFDVKMFATIEVVANNEKDARAALRSKVTDASCNAGCWEDGRPILFEASVDEGDSACELVMIGGEAV